MLKSAFLIQGGSFRLHLIVYEMNQDGADHSRKTNYEIISLPWEGAWLQTELHELTNHAVVMKPQ